MTDQDDNRRLHPWIEKPLSKLRTPARLGLLLIAVLGTWQWSSKARFREYNLDYLLTLAIFLLLAILPWTVGPVRRIVLRRIGASSEEGSSSKRSDRMWAWAVGAAVLLGLGVATMIVVIQFLISRSPSASLSILVVVTCYALSLGVPWNVACSNRSRLFRAIHVVVAVVLSLIYLLFILSMFGTVAVVGRWALLLQVVTLAYCGFRLLTDDQLGTRSVEALAAWLFSPDAGSNAGATEDAMGRSRAQGAAASFLQILSIHRWGPRWLALKGEPAEDRSVLRTAWLVLMFGMILNLVLQITFSIAMVMMLGPPQFSLEVYQSQSQELLTNPIVFMGILVVSQASLLIVALTAAKFSPVPLLERLALHPVHWDKRRWLLLLASCLLPASIGVIMVETLSKWWMPDQTMELVLQRLVGGQWLLYLIAISLLPSFAEELLFRGYFQSRLHRRWHPGWCVAISGIVFGLFHIQPHAILFATIVGLWLAYIAYRSESTWPGIACHASINATMTLVNFAGLHESAGGIVLWIVFAAIGLIPFVVTLRWLSSTPASKRYSSQAKSS